MIRAFFGPLWWIAFVLAFIGSFVFGLVFWSIVTLTLVWAPVLVERILDM